MSFYLLFLFPKNLEAHTTRHLSCPSETFGVYTRPSFPDHDSTQYSSWSSSRTFFLKPPLLSQWPTIPFCPLFFPDSFLFWWKFSLTLLRNHPLALRFSPFWHIGERFNDLHNNLYYSMSSPACVQYIQF